jgi:hypothetical protein
LSWQLLLKAGVGNWSNSIKTGVFPSVEDIKALDEKESARKARELDRVINNLETDLANLPKRRPSIVEGLAQQLYFGTRRVKKISLVEIKKRLEKAKSFKSHFNIEITGQQEVKETLQPLVNDFVERKDIDSFYAIARYVNEITQGNFSSATQSWMRKLNNIIDVPEGFGKAIDNIKREVPDEDAGIDKKISNIFEYKYGVGNNPTTMEITTRSKKDKLVATEEGDIRQRTREVTTPFGAPEEEPFGPRKKKESQIETVSDITTEVAFPMPNIDAKIETLSMTEFKKLINVLHKSTILSDTELNSYKDKAIKILWDISIKSSGTTLNNAMRVVDMGRKGLTLKHRQAELKTNFALDFIKREMDTNPEPFKIGQYKLKPSEEMKNATPEERDVQSALKEQAIDYIRNKLKSGGSDLFDEAWKKYTEKKTVADERALPLKEQLKEAPADEQAEIINQIKQIYQESELIVRPGEIKFQMGESREINFNEIVDIFNIRGKFKQNVFSLLFLLFYESDSKEEFEQEFKRIIPLRGATGNWVDFIPQGKLFASNNRQSFIDSLRAIITIVKDFYSKEHLSDYTLAMTEISDNFYANLNNLLIEISKKRGLDMPDDKEELMEFAMHPSKEYIQDVDGMHYVNNKLGIQADLDTAHNTLSNLLQNLSDRVSGELINYITAIGEDTSDKYTKHRVQHNNQKITVQKYLEDTGYLQQEVGEEE